MMGRCSYSSLLQTYIVRQGRIDEPLYMKEKDLRNLLIDVLDIDFFARIRDRVSTDLKRLQSSQRSA